MSKPLNILITGGAGFIGSNTVMAFHQAGYQLTLVDNFSRPGVELNAKLLKQIIPDLEIIKTDAAEFKTYLPQLQAAHAVIHLAGQTAVTTSIKDPLFDFKTNTETTLLLLDMIRQHNPQAIFIYASTNKVYGDLSHHRYQKDDQLERYQDLTAPNGVGESEALSFISPYGCSKGAADQYVLDYARIYGLQTVVFRQSCIYGEFQQGVEDQGWVAHFTKQLLQRQPLTIYGNGYQVRDLLHSQDLVKAYQLAINHIESVKGMAFNIGGGLNNAYSLLNVIKMIEAKLGYQAQLDFQPARLGDQYSFISANQLIKDKLKWHPTIDFKTGLDRLITWQQNHILTHNS